MPKKLNAYCPFCKKHTAQTVERVRKGRGFHIDPHYQAEAQS